MKQIYKEVEELLEKKHSQLCLQNLMIKLPRLHQYITRVCLQLSLEPCGIIGGQQLLRGHNTILT